MNDEFHHWNFANDFSGEDAAMLIAGIDPSKMLDIPGRTPPKKARPVLERMKRDYNDGLVDLSFHSTFGRVDDGFSFSTSSLVSVNMENAMRTLEFGQVNVDFGDIDAKEFCFKPASNFALQKFDRRRLQVWLDANNLRSKYSFFIPPSPVLDEPMVREELQAKERVTVEKLIGGLALLHGVDIFARDIPIKKLHLDLVGKGVEFDSDTISKWLKLAAKRIESLKK